MVEEFRLRPFLLGIGSRKMDGSFLLFSLRNYRPLMAWAVTSRIEPTYKAAAKYALLMEGLASAPRSPKPALTIIFTKQCVLQAVWTLQQISENAWELLTFRQSGFSDSVPASILATTDRQASA